MKVFFFFFFFCKRGLEFSLDLLFWMDEGDCCYEAWCSFERGKMEIDVFSFCLLCFDYTFVTDRKDYSTLFLFKSSFV